MEEHGIVLQDLIQHFTEMVISIRQNSRQYARLYELIDSLSRINANAINKNKGALFLFQVYETIIQVSMELRKILPQFEIEVSQYSSIDYALYYKNQVYYTRELKPEWLSATKGGLMLHLSPAIKDLEEESKTEAQLAILDLFNQHYQLFLQTVEDSYQRHHNGKSILQNQDSVFNKGHVAEAHERHLQEHHALLYQSVKTKNLQPNEQIEAHILEMQRQNSADTFHETAATIWKQHLLASLGYQRGTVAGDVNSTQVKQGASGASLRLTKVGNLRTGIKAYSDLFNKDIPPEVVGTKIALYMSDIADKDVRTFVNRDFFNEMMKKEPDFAKVFTELEKHLDVIVTI